MNKKTIAALMVEPNEHPKVVQLGTDLDSLQKAVSIGADYQGLIELISLDPRAVLLCNEEGKLIGLPGNRRIGCDVIAGVFYIVGQNNHGDLVSLAPELIETCKAQFWESESFTLQDVEQAMFMRFFTV